MEGQDLCEIIRFAPQFKLVAVKLMGLVDVFGEPRNTTAPCVAALAPGCMTGY